MSVRSSSAHSRACDAGHRKLNRLVRLRSSIWITLSVEPEGRDTGTNPPARSGACARLAWTNRNGRVAALRLIHPAAQEVRVQSPCQRHCGDRYAGLLALTHRFGLEEYAMVPPSAAPGRDVVSTCPPNPLAKSGLSFRAPAPVGKVCLLGGYDSRLAKQSHRTPETSVCRFCWCLRRPVGLFAIPRPSGSLASESSHVGRLHDRKPLSRPR